MCSKWRLKSVFKCWGIFSEFCLFFFSFATLFFHRYSWLNRRRTNAGVELSDPWHCGTQTVGTARPNLSFWRATHVVRRVLWRSLVTSFFRHVYWSLFSSVSMEIRLTPNQKQIDQQAQPMSASHLIFPCGFCRCRLRTSRCRNMCVCWI